VRRQNARLTRLLGLAADIARLEDEHTTLQNIVDTTVRLVGVDQAHLALIDRLEKTLYGVASSGRHHPGALHLRCSLSGSPAARAALRSRRPVAIDNARRDPRVNRVARGLLGIESAAYMPLLSGGQSFGLLILVSCHPHRWTAEELALAKHIASFGSVALGNRRLLTQLAETERRLRSLVEHIPAIVYTCEVHPPYTTLYVSPQTETMLGYSSREWTEGTGFFMKIVHPDDMGKVIDLTEENARTRGFSTTEYRLLDRQGEVRWFRDEAVLMRDPAGEPVAWHGVMVEITGLKKMEQEMIARSATMPGRRSSPEPPPA